MAPTGEVWGVGGPTRPGEDGESGLPGLPGLLGLPSTVDKGLLLPLLRLMLMGPDLCTNRWGTSLASPCSLAEQTRTV